MVKNSQKVITIKLVFMAQLNTPEPVMKILLGKPQNIVISGKKCQKITECMLYVFECPEQADLK